uniref:Uncharacterized protein n=1 Tax=Nelumbo nucifera TaxID=4432 RepID=A0A822ZIM9_NELNU|nr:TPA_asm: hypothetical protein HUJ06_001555 [Nelumbo nucifera]
MSPKASWKWHHDRQQESYRNPFVEKSIEKRI